MRKLIMYVGTLAAVLAFNSGMAYAEEKVYEYGDDGVVNESLELTVDAVAGQDYTVTVEFTGLSDTYETMSLGYDMVTADQMVPNVDTSTDRSGLMDESVISTTVTSRTFNVAAVNDGITIKATGKGKITKITVNDYEADKPEQTAIYTIGDSLVQTYTDYYLPQAGWGQMLQNYFKEENVIVKNHALGGRSSGSFMREGRLNEVLLNVKEGDYVLIEFGHNDASTDKVDRYTSVEDYKIYLEEQYIKAIEQRGGIPVLVTLCNRNQYDANGQFTVSFERYVVAMREVAEATDTLLIDLNAMTVEYFTELNKKYGIGITEEIIFNHADAGEYTGAYSAGVADNTHLQVYGAKLVAGMVAEGLCGFEHDVLVNNYVSTGSASAIPGVPTGLEVQSAIRTLRKIGWTAVKDAEFYKIYAAEVVDGKTGEYKEVGFTTTNNFVYGAADIKTDYMFKVVAANSLGESEESEELLYEAVTKNKNKNTATGVNETDESEGKATVFPIIPVVIAVVAVVVVAIVAICLVVVKKKKK